MPTTDGSTVLDDVRVPPRVSRLDTMLTRLGVTSVPARDSLLAAAVLLLTVGLLVVLFEYVLGAEGLTVGPVQAWVLMVAVCVQALPLALRRTRPVLCLGLVLACQVVIIATSPDDLSLGGIPQVVAGYTVGTLLPARRALAVTGAAVPVAALAATVTALVSGNGLLVPVANHVLSAIGTYVLSALVGGAVATRRRYVELLRLRAGELLRTQQANTQAAIVAERSRMARELHDVAAHHLSGLVVQAAAVERQIDSDPEAAKKGTAWIRAQGKETLDSLRLIVGVLRERPGADGRGADGHDAPPPGLGALDGLVQTARLLGSTVELVREGRPRELAPIADAAFYRVAQESLSNARQHAPGAPVRMTVRFDERAVSLEVVNGPVAGGASQGAVRDPARQGMGLIGMGERAQLVGATLTAESTPSGGWRVLLTLPLHHEHEQHEQHEQHGQDAQRASQENQAPAESAALVEGGRE
ncbi:sensor histidine kinase [Promicromonospora iranensis]|uniref:sensor histidine kinase n=1 Tax=Promicromonospora iranensis TaxID=1105144 RepID=UPI0023A9D62C|nr:histidine kinase [Promicromonospora iranensis]